MERHGLRAALGATALLITALTGCTGGASESARPAASAPPASPSATGSRPGPAAVLADARQQVLAMKAYGADAPDAKGLMTVGQWDRGAAFAWQTADLRICWGTAGGAVELACASDPEAAPSAGSTDVELVAPLFTDGWWLLFTADNREVTSATCAGEPVRIVRVGTLTGAGRTLYSAQFPSSRRGAMTLHLRQGPADAELRLPVGGLDGPDCGPAA